MRNKRQSTRSAVALARKALHLSAQALPAYGSVFSKKDFTQPQLFALLCLKQFLRQDYRGLVDLLAEWSDLRQALRLKKVPHYSTVAHAAKRLGNSEHFQGLWAAVFADAKQLGLVAARPE